MKIENALVKRALMVFCAVACGMVWGATTTSVVDGRFEITVPEGETNTIEAAHVTAAGAGPIYKRGRGGLICDDKLDGYTGDFHVCEGTLKVAHYKGLGTSQDGLTSVSNGATLWIAADLRCGAGGSGDFYTYTNRRFHFCGTGVHGQGALYNQRYGFMSQFALTGDALFGGTQTITFRQSGNLALGGHTLTVRMSSASAGLSLVVMYASTAGNILVEKGTLQIESSSAAWKGTSVNYIRVKKDAVLALRTNNRENGTGVNCPWTIYLEDGAIFREQGSSGLKSRVDENSWVGPVVLEGETLMTTYYNSEPPYGIPIKGAVSGTGGFNVTNRTMLKLANGANSFQGGVKATGLAADQRAWVNLSASEALPPAGGPLAMNNYTTLYLNGKSYAATPTAPGPSATRAYALPAVTASGDVVVTGVYSYAVSANSSNYAAVATMPSLVKRDAGVLDLAGNVRVAGTAEIRAGGIRFPKVPVGRPGLYYFDRHFDGPKEGGGFGNYNRTGVPYKWIEPRGPLMGIVGQPGYGYGDSSNQVFNCLYKGYVWNRTGTNETWNFGSNFSRYIRVDVDGTKVHERNDNHSGIWDRVHISKPFAVTPGAHEIVVQFGNNSWQWGGSNVSGAKTNAAWGIYWDAGNMLVYSRHEPGYTTANCTNSAYYVKFIDSGKGELFTLDATTKDETDFSDLRPSFGTLRMAAGTTLDLNDDAPYSPYALTNFFGATRVLNGKAVLSGTWTVDAADLASGGFVVGKGAQLEIAPGTKVTFTNAAGTRHRDYNGRTLLSVADGGTVTGSLALDPGLAPLWKLEASADGQTVRAYEPRGLFFVIR